MSMQTLAEKVVYHRGHACGHQGQDPHMWEQTLETRLALNKQFQRNVIGNLRHYSRLLIRYHAEYEALEAQDASKRAQAPGAASGIRRIADRTPDVVAKDELIARLLA